MMRNTIHHHLSALAIAATLAACGGGTPSEKGQDAAADTAARRRTTAVAPTRTVQTADAAEQARNRNAAGFQTDLAQRSVSVTQPCFATTTPERLDMLPSTPKDAQRSDTILIRELNEGSVFILNPGDKGLVEGVAKNKLLVRFQAGALWVWRSDVAR